MYDSDYYKTIKEIMQILSLNKPNTSSMFKERVL